MMPTRKAEIRHFAKKHRRHSAIKTLYFAYIFYSYGAMYTMSVK